MISHADRETLMKSFERIMTLFSAPTKVGNDLTSGRRTLRVQDPAESFRTPRKAPL